MFSSWLLVTTSVERILTILTMNIRSCFRYSFSTEIQKISIQLRQLPFHDFSPINKAIKPSSLPKKGPACRTAPFSMLLERAALDVEGRTAAGQPSRSVQGSVPAPGELLSSPHNGFLWPPGVGTTGPPQGRHRPRQGPSTSAIRLDETRFP